MNPRSKYLWIASAMVFLVFLGFVQLGHLAIHATMGMLTENDVIILVMAAGFMGLIWFMRQ